MRDSLLDRRRLLAATGLAAAGLALPGCATPRAVATPATYLPAVDVDPGRVIRHAVGLRPYRAPGFVVRAETLGTTRLVHNHGHGGAGVGRRHSHPGRAALARLTSARLGGGPFTP